MTYDFQLEELKRLALSVLGSTAEVERGKTPTYCLSDDTKLDSKGRPLCNIAGVSYEEMQWFLYGFEASKKHSLGV